MTRYAHFVSILSEGYRGRVEMQPNAAGVIERLGFDEYQVPAQLGKARRLIFQGVWHSGPALPSPFYARERTRLS